MTSSRRDRASKALLWITNHVVSRCVSHHGRLWWYRRVMAYDIAAGASVLVDVRFSARGRLTVGAGSVINNGCRIDNRGGVTIGENSSISYACAIYTKGHVIDSADFRTATRPVHIGDRVWLCAQSTVVPGVTVEDGAVTLTGSVVTKDVPAYAVVGGNPARHLRQRSTDLDYTTSYHPWVPFFG